MLGNYSADIGSSTHVILAEDSATCLVAVADVADSAALWWPTAPRIWLARLGNRGLDERRAATQKSMSWERLGIDSSAGRPDLPTVPPIDAVIDSPGVKLACRLPIDAAPGRLSVALAVVCVVWNLLVADFLFQVIRLHVAASRIG